MATVSLLSRLVNGVQRQVNLSSNTLWVQDLQLNNSSGWTLAGTTSGHAGSSLIGDDNSYTNFAPATATIKGALSAIDIALGSSSGSANTALSNLASVAINTSLLPGTDNSINLGSSTKSWKTANIHTIQDASALPSVDVYSRILWDSSGAVGLNWTTRFLDDHSGTVSVDWGNRTLFDAHLTPLAQLTWSNTGVAFPQLTASTVPYLDASKLLISSSVTPTQLNYLASGSGTTGTGSLVFSNAPTFTGAVNMGGFQINNLATPTSTGDAATKGYVDAAISGLTWKGPVQAYANSNVPLTGGTTLTIDGYSVQNGDLVILGAQTTASQNYVYVASGIGTAYVLTLITGSEAPTALGDAYLIEKGTQYGNSAFTVNALTPNVTFIQFAGPNTLVFTSPLVLSGNTVSLHSGNGLTTTGGNLVVLNADSSISVASGGIAVVNDPAGAIVTGGSGIKVQVSSTGGIQITSNTLSILLATNSGLATSSSGLTTVSDGSTIGVNGSNQLSVLSAGITKTQINTNVFDQTTITGGAGTSASVVASPTIKSTVIAGQTFAANTTYAVRYGLPVNGETAGRIYAADITTSSFDLFWVIGFAQGGSSSVTAGAAITLVEAGIITLGSADTAFGSNDPGKPIFLQSGGTNASTTAPSTTAQAVVAVGIAVTTSTFKVKVVSPYVF